MGMTMDYKDPRWKFVRYEAKRRDKFRCVKCDAPGPLEVDHIKMARDFPELRFELSNLQSLCRKCHSSKTRSEMGFPTLSPERRKWRDLMGQSHHQLQTKG